VAAGADGVAVVNGFRRAAPWVLCALALALLTASALLRWKYPDPEENWLEGTVTGLAFAGIAVMGALIATRLPGNVYGWLWLAAGLIFGLGNCTRAFLVLVDGPPWAAWVGGGASFVSLLALLSFVFLLFPTGRLPSPGWRWLARVAVVLPFLLFTAVLFIPDPGDSAFRPPWSLDGDAARIVARLADAGVLAMFGAVIAGMVSTVLRFRRAGPIERRQLSWFMYAAVVNGVLLAIDSVGWLPRNLFFSLVSAAGFLLLPAAVGFAMLRYRLYDIDRIVSRTVTYGLLTAGIFAVYLLLVTVPPLLGLQKGTPDVVVAAVTLAAAAVVGRARHRLQEAVDRRFDRARYDAARAVDAFSARLRDQIELDQVVGGLRETVAATVAPTRVGVWLREPREV
jgi:hypothetical protein